MTDKQFKIALRAVALSFAFGAAATSAALADPPGYLFQDLDTQPLAQPALSVVSRSEHWSQMATGGSNEHVASQSNATTNDRTNAS